jgi:hypothetical protein
MACLFGHKWDGCKCPKCGKTRDELHDWDLCKGKCKRCGKMQPEQHEWQGCKCSRCGKTRDEQHDWQGCKCSKCGKTRDEGHNWHDCKCTKCGKENHHWVDGKCSLCNKEREKSCSVCGITNTEFDNHYKAQAARGVVIISRDKLVNCDHCNYVICTVCLNKAGGNGWGYPNCPSCKAEPSYYAV